MKSESRTTRQVVHTGATMRAVRKVRHGPGLEVGVASIPKVGSQEVLLEVKAASLCGTDLHIYDWDEWAASNVAPPLTVGHECCGVVAEVGDEAEGVEVGDLVAVEGHFFCDNCPICRIGRRHLCLNMRLFGVTTDGCFAEYVRVPARNVWKLPPDTPPTLGALMDPFGNAVHTVFAGGDVEGKTVAVTGCGPIGLMAVAICRAAGAARVVATDVVDHRLELACKMGADNVVNVSDSDLEEAVDGVDVLLEMSGHPEAINRGLGVLWPGGRAALLGIPPGKVEMNLAEQVILKGVSLHGVFGRRVFETWERAANLLKKVDLTPVITHSFPLEDIEEAFALIRSGECGKVVLLPPGNLKAVQGERSIVETGRYNPLEYLDAELAALKSQGLLRTPPVLEGACRARCRINGREVVNLSSNNYLGLCDDLRLKEAAVKATESHGVGSGAVRTIIGTQDLHLRLESKLAEFKKTEAVLVFQSGFTANAGTVSAILGRQDHIVSDRLNHASIIDGARLSRAKVNVYEHSDMDSLREKLEEAQAGARESGGRILVITDGVFSMDGDIARLPEVVEIAEEHGAIMMVDDAHASGVLGANGRGTVDHFGLHGRVDVQVGTLSKAIGVLGGYVAGNQALIDFLIHRARPFLFSTSHPPAVTAACIAALDILLAEPEIIDRLWENTRFFKDGLISLGFDTGASGTPITPVIAGDEAAAMELSDRLFEAGIFVQGIAFPTVPQGSARVRAMVMAPHTREDLGYALEAFERVGKEMGLIP